MKSHLNRKILCKPNKVDISLDEYKKTIIKEKNITHTCDKGILTSTNDAITSNTSTSNVITTCVASTSNAITICDEVTNTSNDAIITMLAKMQE